VATPAAAIVTPTRWQRVTTTSGALTIKPKIGRHTVLKDIFIAGASAEDYIDIEIGSRHMLRIYVETLDCILIDKGDVRPQNLGFLSWVKSLVPDWADLYAAHDEDLVITPSGSYTALTAWYDRVEATAPGDKTLPGGSQCKVMNHIYWISHSGTISADATDASFDYNLLPAGVHSLVDDGQVKNTEQFDLTAIVCGNNNVSTDTHLDRVKLIDEGVMIGTPETQEGFLVDPASGNELQADILYKRIFRLPEPYILGKGHKYGIKYDVDHVTTNRSAGYYKLGLIGVHRQLV